MTKKQKFFIIAIAVAVLLMILLREDRNGYGLARTAKEIEAQKDSLKT